MMETRDNRIVIGDAYRKFLIAKDGGNREWVFIIECTFATAGDLCRQIRSKTVVSRRQ
jgi:hypothetical protein